jgi:hypothetical protein
MEMKPDPSASVKIEPGLLLRLKYELMNSYGALQAQEPSEKKDSGWVAAIKGAKVGATIKVAFSGTGGDCEESRGYMEVLEAISTTWR